MRKAGVSYCGEQTSSRREHGKRGCAWRHISYAEKKGDHRTGEVREHHIAGDQNAKKKQSGTGEKQAKGKMRVRGGHMTESVLNDYRVINLPVSQ